MGAMNDRLPSSRHRPSLGPQKDVASTGVSRMPWVARAVLLLVMSAWAVSIVSSRWTDPPTVLHLTVILFHEAGHVLFMPFGETLGVAGGTLGQLLMPAICAVAFQRRDDAFGTAMCVAWAGLSLIDASIYAYDAADPVLPLIGGGTGADSFHDFIYLFDRFGELGHARRWARAMKGLGALVAFGALAWGGLLLRRQRHELID